MKSFKLGYGTFVPMIPWGWTHDMFLVRVWRITKRLLGMLTEQVWKWMGECVCRPTDEWRRQWVSDRVRTWAPVLIIKWANDEWQSEGMSESASDFRNQSLLLIFFNGLVPLPPDLGTPCTHKSLHCLELLRWNPLLSIRSGRLCFLW